MEAGVCVCVLVGLDLSKGEGLRDDAEIKNKSLSRKKT